MKKRNLIYFIGILTLAFIPLIRVSVAAPPCWVGVYEDEVYIWQYNNHTAAALGDWTTDGVVLTIFLETGAWAGWADEMLAYGPMPGNLTHEITSVGDLGPDLEFGSNYPSVQVLHAVNYTPEVGTPYDWEDKGTGSNVWAGLVLEDETDFVMFHNNLTSFFDSYDPLGWSFTSLWASTKMDWSTVVAVANTELAGVGSNLPVTALTDGFTLTVAALDWGTNTKAIELSVTFKDGLLNTWDLTYGTDTVLDVDLVQGSTQFSPCTSDAIPGFELPIIIGVVSIISLILIKKVRKK